MVSRYHTEETTFEKNPIPKKYANFNPDMCLWGKYAHSKIKATRPNDKIKVVNCTKKKGENWESGEEEGNKRGKREEERKTLEYLQAFKILR